jgi:hypothetical protein
LVDFGTGLRESGQKIAFPPKSKVAVPNEITIFVKMNGPANKVTYHTNFLSKLYQYDTPYFLKYTHEQY